MTLDEINRLRALKAKDDGIAFDLEVLKAADELLDAAERAERAKKANAVLRAECEAWRELNDTEDATFEQLGILTFYVDQARQATDAAGALKGENHGKA